MAGIPLTSVDPGTSGAAPPILGAPTTVLPSSMQLGRNPQLPQHPLGAYTDSIYEAAIAQLQNQISKQYADILQQLGYTDENGNFVQGSVEANARRSESDLMHQADLATEGVTKQHQQLGTLFSGLRGTDQARATEPMVNQISQIETDTPLTLQQLYEKASGLTNDYVLQQNQYLADAASRAAANQLGNPGDSGAIPDGSAAPPPTAPLAPSPIPTPFGNIGNLNQGVQQAAAADPNATRQVASALLNHLNRALAPPDTSVIAAGQGHNAPIPNLQAISGAINARRPGAQM